MHHKHAFLTKLINMALIVQGVKRAFKMKKAGKMVDVPDPNPDFTPDEVMSFLSNQHPELTTSTISGPEMQEDGTAVYEFKTTVGTKG
jgi:PRTRC genetic system protein C